jgi:transposase InsO family protein
MFGQVVRSEHLREAGEEARTSIPRWIKEYNHDRPDRGVGNRTPREAFLAFAGVLSSETTV